MQLLTQELRDKLPPLYASENLPPDKVMAVCKFFTPDSNWTWYAVEFDGENLFFGLVDGMEMEPGYFCLSELETSTGPMGLHIERDLYWRPRTLAEIAPQRFDHGTAANLDELAKGDPIEA